MKSTALFKHLNEKGKEDPAARSLVTLVERVFQEAINVTKAVVKYMPEYTLHDEVHLTNVVDIMGRLIPKGTLARLHLLEIASLILSAALHDIGIFSRFVPQRRHSATRS